MGSSPYLNNPFEEMKIVDLTAANGSIFFLRKFCS